MSLKYLLFIHVISAILSQMTTPLLINQPGEKKEIGNVCKAEYVTKVHVSKEGCTKWISHWDLSWVQWDLIFLVLTQMADQRIGSLNLEANVAQYIVTTLEDKNRIQNGHDELEIRMEKQHLHKLKKCISKLSDRKVHMQKSR